MNITWRPTPNYNSRPAGGFPPSVIVLHHTAGYKAGDLDRMADLAAKVSAHYYVTKTGEVYRLVEDMNRAWHAGESSWKGRGDVNDFSLGIETENLGTGQDPWPGGQIVALAELVASKLKVYQLTKADVTDHKTISPGRKTDLASNFPWQRFWEELDKHMTEDSQALYNIHITCSWESVSVVMRAIQAAGYTAKAPATIPVVVYNATTKSAVEIEAAVRRAGYTAYRVAIRP